MMHSERELRVAAQKHRFAIERTPNPASFSVFHSISKRLNDNFFHLPKEPWLNSFELAAVANQVAMFGSTKEKHQRSFNIATPLNSFKELWKLSEERGSYSSNPEYAATFTLRVIYQQLPFIVHSDRVRPILKRTCSLFSSQQMDGYIESKFRVGCTELFGAFDSLYSSFSTRPSMALSELRPNRNDAIRIALQLLSADRSTRTGFYRNRLELTNPADKVYEINSFLRYPIVARGDRLDCPFPQLIGYAASRGLYFRLNEEDGDAFRAPFARSFESCVSGILSRSMPTAEVLTETDERALGWLGKTNDVTAILGDCALLVECKLSGLYVNAKRTASPDAIIADIRKQIAEVQDRRGLYQLYEKIKAIRTGTLPSALGQKYLCVKHFYPVILIFDDIAFANAPEVLGNIIRDELKSCGVEDFTYQIWQFEHLEWLAQFAGRDLMAWVADKFTGANQITDLNSFIVDRTGRKALKDVLYLPGGDTKAIQTLRSLITKYDQIGSAGTDRS
jgi:hypothetical protein